jgi:hypothetical protein
MGTSEAPEPANRDQPHRARLHLGASALIKNLLNACRLMQHLQLDIKGDKMHHSTMRTTLTLDDDVFELATRQAKLRGVSLGRAVSDLMRRGLAASTPSRNQDGLVVFDLPLDSPVVTTEDVRRIEAEGA